MHGFKDFINEGRDFSVEHEVVGMYRDSRYSVAEIVRATGLSAAGIYRVLEKYSVKPARRGRNDMHDSVLHYAALNVPAQKISELTGFSRRHVYNILRNNRPQPDPLHDPTTPDIVG